MNEKVIWDFLYDKLQNAYGAAGLMGNLYVESKLNPKNLQSSAEKKLKMTDEEYTNAVDNGIYPSFVGDKYGYGLAQWSYSTRKEKLLEFAKQRNESIGNLNMQLLFLWNELQTYKTCLATLKNAKNVREASDAIVEKYEKPADQSEKAKQNRANYGIEYYNTFVAAASQTTRMVTITANDVNIRCGNGKEYGRLGQVKKNEKLEYVAETDNWYAVKYSKRVGWVSKEFSK